MRLPMSRREIVLLLLGTVSLSAVGCQGDGGVTENNDGSTSVRMALNWFPEAEHGGYFSAQADGFFEQQKLDVEIIPGGPGAPQSVISELAAGRILCAVSDADNVVKARAAGVDIVAVMAPMQMSPRCIMVHRSSGITKLDQLADLELAISDGRPFALWMKEKLPLTNVTFVPYNGQIGEFLTKDNFAQQAFVFSEPFLATEAGSDPQAIMVSDIGFNPYASVLITTEAAIKEHPELIRKVVSASVQGWQTYLQSPEAANNLIHSLNEEMKPPTLEFGAAQLVGLCTSDTGIAHCQMTLQRWTELVSQIEEIGDIEAGAVSPDACFTNQFLSN